MSILTCMDVEGRLSYLDRQRHIVHEFDVPEPARLIVDFEYEPTEVGPVRNLITIALYDGDGEMRGAAHRWRSPQSIKVGEWSATPGFVAGPIKPGAWACVLDIHDVMNTGDGDDWCRYTLRIHCEPDAATLSKEPEWAPARTTSRSGAGWYRGDLHSHTVHCDGSGEVLEMAVAARDVGLEFLAITGHNTISTLQTPPVWPSDLVPMPGIELTTFAGHAGILGVGHWVEWRSCVGGSLESARLQVQAEGGVFIVNHPAAIGNPWCTGCTWGAHDVELGHVDAIEVWNGPWPNPQSRNQTALAIWDKLLMQGHRVTAVGGGDVHETAHYRELSLPVTSVYASLPEQSALLDGIRAGHVVISSGPRISLEKSGAPLIPGEETQPGDIAVVVDHADEPLELVQISGGSRQDVIQVPPPGGEYSCRLTDSMEWVRWELRNRDDEMVAMTNPVYNTASR